MIQANYTDITPEETKDVERGEIPSEMIAELNYVKRINPYASIGWDCYENKYKLYFFGIGERLFIEKVL